MDTTNPTAWPSFAFFQMNWNASNVIFTSFHLLRRCHPTNPLVPCERREAVPGRKNLRIGDEDFFQICGDGVDGA